MANRKKRQHKETWKDNQDDLNLTTAAEDPLKIEIKNELLDILETAESPDTSSTATRHSKRKTAVKANENMKQYFKNEDIDVVLNSPKRKYRKITLHDKPDLIDISTLVKIKQEDCGDDNSLLDSEDSEPNQLNNDEMMIDISALQYLETDLEVEDTTTKEHVPSDKIFLKTDQILGIKSIKKPTKGPQHIGGCVDTKGNTFKVKCEHCGEQFHNKFRFNTHLHVVHKIKKENCVLQCKYCPQRSKTTWSLKFHMLMYHLDELNLKTKWYKCSKCGLKSTSSEDIVGHKEESIWCQGAVVLLFHTCSECPFQTDRLSKLQGHIKCHFKAGSFKCPHCTFKCASSDSKKMNEHILLHKS